MINAQRVPIVLLRFCGEKQINTIRAEFAMSSALLFFYLIKFYRTAIIENKGDCCLIKTS